MAIVYNSMDSDRLLTDSSPAVNTDYSKEEVAGDKTALLSDLKCKQSSCQHWRPNIAHDKNIQYTQC